MTGTDAAGRGHAAAAVDPQQAGTHERDHRKPGRQPAAAFSVGRPRFSDSALAALAAGDGGSAAAWTTALSRNGFHLATLQTALNAVDGDFAFGLTLSDGTTVLAVDRFAVQTVCWRVIDGQVHFAQRADALAAMAPVAQLDPQALFHYLYFHVVPAPLTVFDGVQRVPAGHFAVFEPGRAPRMEPYWVPRFEEPAQADFDTLAAEFRDRLQGAVASRLDGGKPGCFLSGGTDSSTVAGMIGRAAGRPAASYSIGFAADGYDEMAFARLAARHFGCEHHEYYVTPDDLVRNIPDVAAHYDQPFGNSSALPAFHCAQMARQDGVTTLLAGDGGDELFGGNARYAKQRIFGWYDVLPGTLRRAVLEPLLERTPAGRLPLLKKGASYVQQAKVPLPDRLQQYNLLLRLGLEEVLEPEFLARIDRSGPAAAQRAVWSLTQGQEQRAGSLNRQLAFDWRFTLADADLPKVVGTTALAGIGVDFPFLDRGLVDFSLRLPAEYKLKGLKLRWFFKQALRGFLPDEILTKRKQGFGLPFGVWAVNHAGLRALATDSLRSLATRGIVKPSFIDELLRQHLPAHPAYYGEMVWILMMLEQWLRARPAGMATTA